MKFLIVVLLVIPSLSLACSFDTDCNVGSRCIKESGALEGICIGGLYPGNDNDRKPYKPRLDLNKKIGNTCSFNTDCGVGGRCVKSEGSIYGVCMASGS